MEQVVSVRALVALQYPFGVTSHETGDEFEATPGDAHTLQVAGLVEYAQHHEELPPPGAVDTSVEHVNAREERSERSELHLPRRGRRT